MFYINFLVRKIFYRGKKMNNPVDLSFDDNPLTKSAIFSDIMKKNNRRMLKAFMTILAIGNIAVTAIKYTGKGSAYLTYQAIMIQIVLIISILLLTELIIRKRIGTFFAGYVTITSIFLSLWIFQFSFYGSYELFATNYVALALCIFYFNPRLCIFGLILTIVSQTTMFVIKPELIPAGPASNVMVRYIVYFAVGIGATSGASAARQLLKLTVEKHKESIENIASLREMARSVLNTILILKNHTSQQEEISSSMNSISENQAAALNEITASLENLAVNAMSVTETSRSLYEEMNLTVDGINDLKEVNDSLQNDSLQVKETLTALLTHSEQSMSHMDMTRERFNTVLEKSNEMTNFINVINDIADKVNLLSLNASIEAARAGAAGRGFVVVAEQISKLADETSSNSKEIERIVRENAKLIDESSGLIGESAALTDKLHSAISGVREQIGITVNKIEDIDLTIKTIRNLNDRVHNFSRTIEESTNEQKVSTEMSSKTTSEIADQAGEIVNISRRINDSTRTLNELAEGLKSMAGGIVA